MYNGSLIPEGGWTLLADKSNITCYTGNPGCRNAQQLLVLM